MIKVDYNNIWYSFFKATKEEIKEYLKSILNKHNFTFSNLIIKKTFTNWEHSNYNIVFNAGNNDMVYDVEADTITEYKYNN